MTASRYPITRRAIAAALAAVLTAGPVAAAPPPWQDAPFSYYAENKPLDVVLREFASAFSLSTDLPAGLQGMVNGKFTYRSPTEFIDRLGSTFGFNWFTHAGVLFVSRSQDLLVRSIPTSAAGPGTNLRQMLTDLKVLDPRFGWGELAEQGVVVVSGPPAYVRLIESTIQSLPSTPGGQQVAVFRFKHASVEDRTILYRDKEITTPGVATILRNLVLGPSSTTSARATTGALAAAGVTNNPFMATTPEAARPAVQGQVQPQGQGNIAVPPANPSRIRPSVQADPRINAVIVQDTPERMPIYERLVAQLDVPTPLIEIEAMIIDVNTTRLAELGVAWNYAGRDRSIALGYGDISTAVTANTLSIAGGSRGQINPTTILPNAGNFFIARLRALEQEGDASIQARPSILTAENLGAVLDLSETFYIQTTSERTALVTPVTAGTTLRVTPRLVGQGETPAVRLTVDIEDGQIQQDNTIGGVPTVRRGTVSTEASVRLDESLLIGGYNSVQTVNSRDKVPFFGDLPVLGTLFSARSQKMQRRERLFLIRTTVIGTMSQTSGVSYNDAPQPSGAPAAQPAAAIEAPGPVPTFTPATQPPAPRVETRAASAVVAAVNRDVMRIDPAVQRSRDRDARRILEEELKTEADALARLEQESAQGRGDAAAERRMRAHRYNMEQIRKELARLRE